MTNTFIAEKFKNKIYRKRVTKSEIAPPYIVYTTEGYTNKLWHHQWVHGLKPRRLVVDIVGPYTDDDMLEAAGTEVLKMLGSFNGTMGDWKGTIKQIDYDDWYDEKSDFSVVRIVFLAKEVF